MIERGELWWADLGEPRGSGPGLSRPVLVVSSDAFNRSRIATVICAVVSTNLRLADAPGNVLVDAESVGLEQTSVINVSQVITLDKQDLIERFGVLQASVLARVEAGLRLVLDLERHYR